MREVLKGNYAIAYAVKQANVDFIPVYPITPQTSIIRKNLLNLHQLVNLEQSMFLWSQSTQ